MIQPTNGGLDPARAEVLLCPTKSGTADTQHQSKNAEYPPGLGSGLSGKSDRKENNECKCHQARTRRKLHQSCRLLLLATQQLELAMWGCPAPRQWVVPIWQLAAGHAHYLEKGEIVRVSSIAEQIINDNKSGGSVYIAGAPKQNYRLWQVNGDCDIPYTCK